MENLLLSWREFLRGKRKKKDVAEFSLCLMDNLLSLQRELTRKTYKHGKYKAFKINDPKPRDIHKASVRDRLIHHAIYRILYPYFDRKFIFDSYSCRIEKGTHKAINRFRVFARKVSQNNSKTAWVLKCDIKKFFANIDHGILMSILKSHIDDNRVIWLLEGVIESFCSCHKEMLKQVQHDNNRRHKGLPLGNLKSQLLVNVYMNEFDQFVKRELKIKYYIRYADDFVVLHENKVYLENLIQKISEFLERKLKISLHPKKVFIKTLSSGIDFLGWVNFPYHRVLRSSTRRRMFRKLKQLYMREAASSYLGLLKHGNTYKLIQELERVAKEKMGLV